MSEKYYRKVYYYEPATEGGRASRTPRPRAKLMGVCAGIAHQLGWDVALVRIVALILLCLCTIPTFFIYIILGLVFY